MKKIFSRLGSIVSYVSAFITIGVAAKGTIEKQQYSLLSIVTNVWIWIAIVFIILAINLYRLSKRLKIIENESSIPTIKDKFFLAEIHKKQKRSKYIDNCISITSLEKITKITGNSERKDSNATLKIYGELLRDSDNFKFIITTDYDSFSLKDKITITAKDANTKDILNVHTPDKESFNKEFIVSYNKRMAKGSFIALEISWIWPRMFDVNSGYVTLSTCYSKITKNIKHTFIPHGKQNFDKISLFKYRISMKEPIFLREISKKNGIFVYEEEEPDQMSDFILCYETLL